MSAILAEPKNSLAAAWPLDGTAVLRVVQCVQFRSRHAFDIVESGTWTLPSDMTGKQRSASAKELVAASITCDGPKLQ